MASHDQIMELERRFWQSMKDMDVDAAVALIDEQSASVSGWGIHHFGPAEYRAMALAGTARITAFEFFDEQVIFPLPDVAVATYGARQSFTMEGKNHDMVVYDTTTWVRKDGRWLACAHTESAQQEVPPRD
ncbi:MAG: nuclear transport factor 2 family protein [Pseudoxanthomonas sp.]|nr:nuclear transport factor 2 family protein [Pseudoxanthomonas sp.]